MTGCQSVRTLWPRNHPPGTHTDVHGALFIMGGGELGMAWPSGNAALVTKHSANIGIVFTQRRFNRRTAYIVRGEKAGNCINSHSTAMENTLTLTHTHTLILKPTQNKKH
jgi:hypothetical protein